MSKKKHEIGAVEKAQDAVGGMVGAAVAAVGGGSTDAFVENAVQGDRYELMAAQIAARRARDIAVRGFAQQMIADHMTSSHHLMSALTMNETRGVKPPPAKLDNRRQGLIDHLMQASDEQFLDVYLAQQRASHRESEALFANYAQNGDNPQLRSFARGTLPVLMRHRKHVRALRRLH